MKLKRILLIPLLSAALFTAVQLAADSKVTPVHASDALFAPDRLIQVEVRMAPEDWQALRISHRVTGEDFSQVADNPYQYYRADVTIDGQKLNAVGIRKKGFFGSAISTRPSLKLKLDRYVEDQAFSGLSTLTFNNNNQDASRMQSFVVYRFMNDAGANSPRANFARIIVNGEDLGIYTHVESVDKALIKRLFKKAKGDLWEGYAGDFTEADFNRIVHKMGKDDNSETLQELYDLLQSPDPIPLEAVGQLIDIDAFITLWASEVLIGHWDGYASNRNNYYMYREPKSGLFYFIPWGPDSAFWDPGPFLPAGLPKSFKARGYLCQRLWELPEVRSRYRNEMQRLLNDVWNEKQMLADLQQAGSLIQPFSTASVEAAQRNIGSIRKFISGRRGEVQAELDAPAVDWPETETKGVAGPKPAMEVVGRFSSVYSIPEGEPSQEPASDDGLSLFANVSTNLIGTGMANIEFTVEGVTYKPFTNYGVRTTPGDPDFIRKGYPVIELIASADSDHPPWRLTLTMDPHQLSEGKNSLPIDHFTVWALMSQGEPGAPDAKTTAFGISGELELDSFSRTAGAKVSGQFRLRTSAF
jgi:spore coat protein CotH